MPVEGTDVLSSIHPGAVSGFDLMTISFTITENDGVARKSFPVTGGIAVAQGILQPAEILHLTDSAGQILPLQHEILGKWPDGSIRWLLLDFQADLGANEIRSFKLEKGLLEPLPDLVPEGIVDGEPLPRRRQAPSLVSSRVRIIDDQGREWTDRTPGPTVAERHGSLRATIRTSGTVAAPDGSRRIRWEARTDFHRKTDLTRTIFTYICDAVPRPLCLQEIAVVASLPAGGTNEYIFAGANAPWMGPMTPLVSDQPGAILQTDANDSRIIGAGDEVLREQTLKNRGWAGVTDGRQGLALGLADFWQSFPKSIRAAATTLEAVLWPSESPQRHILQPGAARSHTIALCAFGTPEEADDRMAALVTPILPRQSITDFNAAGVMPRLLPRENTPVPFLEALTELMNLGETTFTTRANAGVWGLGDQHYGDFRADSYADRGIPGVYGDGTIWGNGEAQVPCGLLVQYLRTGAVERFVKGYAAARHEADVDTIHDSPDPEQLGGQHSHGANHAGFVTVSHVWTSGIALAYLLTGNGRLKAVLEETGRYLVRVSRRENKAYLHGREGGWLLIALCANYEALGDDGYLAAARRVVEEIRNWIDNGAQDPLPGAGMVFVPVMLFIALTGVVDYWHLTGDPLARDAILKGGELVLARGRTDLGFFMMEDGPSYRYPSRWQLCHSLPVLCALHELTGEAKWIEAGLRQSRLMLALLEGATKWQEETNWAQGGIYFAYAFRFFETARRLGLLADIR